MTLTKIKKKPLSKTKKNGNVKIMPFRWGQMPKYLIFMVPFLIAGILTVGILSAHAELPEGMDPEADKILKSMTTYLGSLPSLKVRADIDNEFIDLAGQKLQLSSSAEVTISRPSKLNVNRQSPFADSRLVFNGRVITLYDKDHSIYAQIDHPGTIDDAIETIEDEFGLDAPASDLFFTDPYPGLISDVMSSAYHGSAYVAGIECHHLAFRQNKVDWQLWIQVGDKPLPMKYVITTKWLTGAPQYIVRFRDWNLNPQIVISQFEFKVPTGAQKIEKIAINEMGEFTSEGSE